MDYKRKKAIAIAVVAFILGHFFMMHLELSPAIHIIYMVAFLGLFAKTTSSHNSVFVFRVIIPIVVGLGLVSLYRYLYQVPEAIDFLSASARNNFYLERLFQSLSTLYAIMTAFLLWKGISDHDDLRLVLKDEGSQIQSVIGFLNYLKSPANKKYTHEVRKKLATYLERIVQGESITAHEGNYDLLSDIRTDIGKMEANGKKESVAVAEIMKGLNKLFQIRMKRISYMESRLSPYILIALGFMSLSIIYVLFTSPPADTVVIDTIIFIMGTLMSFMLMMLIDIGTPFEGYWKLKVDSFQQIKTNLNKEIDDHQE